MRDRIEVENHNSFVSKKSIKSTEMRNKKRGGRLLKRENVDDFISEERP